ncbi:MAG: SUMF1/EgtB/PvdO family nonheme iron enzyme [Deltaproteobacteria bacterium]|nr:SUMF1/EgtB/PvdO family nonheme iron enzyme [Deltaproteobacteria bacterium]MBI4224114.1 SUMF1/EgtB/PvdO family nonheme iron enzyme [Deltaproteobacteria bacterium]
MRVPIITCGAAALEALFLSGYNKKAEQTPKKDEPTPKQDEPFPNDWISIPAGSFKRGDENGEKDEKPVKDIYVSAFELQKHEVTYGEYRGVLAKQKGKPFEAVVQCGDEPAVTISKSSRKGFFFAYDGIKNACKDDKSFTISSVKNFPEEQTDNNQFNGDNQPALVNWFGAQSYCEAIGGRLPTEAEWERAAKGKSGNDKYPTSHPDTLVKDGEYLANYSWKGSANVCSYPESSYGFCDLAGNVWEWVADWYQAEAYTSSETKDPKGPVNASNKGLRGESWYFGYAGHLRAAFRGRDLPDVRYYDVGFRCARQGS